MSTTPAPSYVRELTITVGGGSVAIHITHGILTLLSLGIWAPIWVTYAIVSRRRVVGIRLRTDGGVDVIQ